MLKILKQSVRALRFLVKKNMQNCNKNAKFPFVKQNNMLKLLLKKQVKSVKPKKLVLLLNVKLNFKRIASARDVENENIQKAQLIQKNRKKLSNSQSKIVQLLSLKNHVPNLKLKLKLTKPELRL